MNTLLSPVVPFVLLNVMIGIIAFTSKLANQTKHSSNQQDHSHQNHQNQSHNHHQQQQQQFQQKKNWLARSPSILERVRSINLYSYKSQEPNLVTSSTSATTNFSFEHVQKHENSSQYIFEQPHQENHHESTPQPQVHVQYTFGHTQEENTQKSNAFSTNIKEFVSNNDNAEHLEQEQHHQEEEEVEDVFEEDGDELESLDEVYTNSTLNHLTRTKSDTDPCSGEAPQKLPTKIRKSASMKSSFGHFEAEDIVETLRPKTMREMGVAKMTEMDHGVDAKADNFISMFRNQLKLQRMDSIIRYKEMITRGSEK
ncbi:hypothetical protein Leryth_000569 [Lithospermum erythrorhizon]|nr:hypothetical protein Leryth_000569 [Lithospermum erythrorhizon]